MRLVEADRPARKQIEPKRGAIAVIFIGSESLWIDNLSSK
jgi:hypothetical protein